MAFSDETPRKDNALSIIKGMFFLFKLLSWFQGTEFQLFERLPLDSAVDMVCLFWTIKLERDLNDLLIMVPSTDNLTLLPCFLHIYLYRSCTIWQCSLWPLFRFG